MMVKQKWQFSLYLLGMRHKSCRKWTLWSPSQATTLPARVITHRLVKDEKLHVTIVNFQPVQWVKRIFINFKLTLEFIGYW